MHRSICPRRPIRSAAAGITALGLVLGATALGAPLASAQVVIEDPPSSTSLEVAPGERTHRGVELTLTATVVDVDGERPIAGQPVHFGIDDRTIAVVDLDEAGRAVVTITPPTGAHQLAASYGGDGGFMPSWDVVSHSVLPSTCADEARPGAGAVVRHAYLVALRRCPDAPGYAYWVGRLEADAAPGAMAAALARSPEAVDVLVDEAYRRILARRPEPAGRAVWAAKLRTGWATSQLWAALAASPEFAADTDGPGALVARAFERIVERTADAAGAAYWETRLRSGTPSATWRALAVSAEVVDGVVADAHHDALGRAPSPVEADAARATIRARRGDWRLVLARLLGQDEASMHAQRYPDPQLAG